MKSLYEIINELSKAEVKKVLSDATAKANELEGSLVEQFAEKQNERLEKAIILNKTLVTQRQKESEFKLNQVKGSTQREVLDSLFIDALKTLNGYTGEKLLDLVVSLVRKSGSKGSETIAVNKNDYNKFLSALSSNTRGDAVVLDKLNKKLSDKANYKLSNKPAGIADGFLVLGNEYDLSFEFKALVASLQENREKEVSEILFNEKS